MLGRKTYTPREIETGRRMVDQQLAAYRNLPGPHDAVTALEPVLFNTALLALDRLFVHRLRAVAGSDTNPLTEVAVLASSLLDHDGVVQPLSPVRYDAARSVLGLQVGERIEITAGDFEKLADAFLTEVHTRFR